MKINITQLIFLLSIMAFQLNGQDLVYKPINPAFGGDTFNYQWLMNSAQEQNDFKEGSDYSLNEKDPLKQFEDDLNRQILSQISRRLMSDIFGEGGLKDGTFELGGFQIEINSFTDGIHIDILDVNNASETSIIVPYF